MKCICCVFTLCIYTGALTNRAHARPLVFFISASLSLSFCGGRMKTSCVLRHSTQSNEIKDEAL